MIGCGILATLSIISLIINLTSQNSSIIGTIIDCITLVFYVNSFLFLFDFYLYDIYI